MQATTKRVQNILVNQSLRSFGYSPQIRFIGKRTQTDKSVGVYGAPKVEHKNHAPHAAQTLQGAQASGVLKALSPMCEVRTGGDADVKRFSRLSLSKEEIDVINNGGYEEKQVGDWRKIKY